MDKTNTLETIRHFLSKSTLFQHIESEELTKIAPEFKTYNYGKNSIIIQEGENSERFYLIQSGTVEIWKNYNSKDAIKLSIQGAGSSFGELSVFDDFPRSATAVSVEDSTILCLHKSDFIALCDSYPQIMFSVLRALASMVRSSNDSLVSNLSIRNKELQNALQELKQTQNELIRSERLSNLGKLSSLIIHDLRNPLSVIKGYAEMLQVLYKSPEQVQDYSKKIVGEVGHLNYFAQELLDYSRGKVRLSRVFTSLPNIFQKLQSYIGKSIIDRGMELRIENSGSEGFYLDEDRMIRALLNICDNSQKAMSKGGVLKIEGEISKGSIHFTISDNGHGMDADVLEHIYDPFFSSSHSGGTGLGMLSVKSTVEAHKGTISITSAVDEGTEVRISIPLKNELIEEGAGE